MTLLPEEFYLRDDVISIARDLLGQILVVESENSTLKAIIVETEAYRGADDKGCHSFIHGRTPRTDVMFESGGRTYVYICYGMHAMVNVVTNAKDKADAVLIRAVEPLHESLEIAQNRRKILKSNYHLTGGPGKVCQALGIDKSFNGCKFYDVHSPIKIEIGADQYDIISTPRVGMSKNVGDYSNMPWRFYLKGNPYVSRPLQLQYKW